MSHTEHLRPPLLWGVVLVLVAATFVIAVAVFLPGWAALASLGVAVVAVVAMMLAFTATVHVTGTGLTVGTSTVEWPYVGEVRTLTKDEVRTRMGPGADPRAFVTYRSYAEEAVEVVIEDSADPHPYWLVSTHDAPRLAGAIEAARTAAAATKGEA
ncbi:MAG: DUF3093 family protein [Propionibacteriaceae bacterium]